MRYGKLKRLLLLGAAALISTKLAAETSIGIIIDDLGDRLDYGRRTVMLPGAVTLAFLPHTPHAPRLAREGYAQGKEIMLHLPMESVAPRPLGPGGVTLHMTREEFTRTLDADLASVPYVRGVNNHMGSLLTLHPGHMGWLMEELRRRGGLYFIDSRTTPQSVAFTAAAQHGLECDTRDVFLDRDRRPAAIRAQWYELLALAKRRGSALAIGHPYPETLALLETELPRLAERGVRLALVSELVANRRPPLWQASLSPSPKVVKNSKP